MASIMRRWMETDHAEFEIDQELKIGPDAGKLDDAPVLPIFSRQDVEHEFRRWRWEAARHSNIVVIAALMIVGGLMAGVGDEFFSEGTAIACRAADINLDDRVAALHQQLHTHKG